jgi:hypothetical protein
MTREDAEEMIAKIVGLAIDSAYSAGYDDGIADADFLKRASKNA